MSPIRTPSTEGAALDLFHTTTSILPSAGHGLLHAELWVFFNQISAEDILFYILYGITGVVPLIAAVYLLFRRGNAIALDVTPPVRLRRWTASFFAVTTLAHVWWLLFYLYSGDLQSLAYLVLAMLDCVLLFVTFAGMLLAMLQDRRRPVQPPWWP